MSIKLHLSTTASQSTRVPNAFSSSITHIAATHLPKASLSFRRPVTNGLRIGAWAKSNIASIKTRRPCMEVVCAVAKLEEVEAVSLDENPRTLAEKLPSSTGVYAMFDKANHLQFIGISRRLSDTVLGHLRDVPHLCGSVKIATIEANDRATLTEAWKVWMEEHINSTGKVPPGNESGNDTWVRKQKTTSKADLRLTPGRHVQLTVSLEQLIDKLVKENEVVAFIKGSRVAPQCGFSHRVLTMLNENGVVYESVDVLDEEHNPGLREALKMYSGWPTFPQVFVRGELVGGADILTEMSEKGELRKLFGNKG